MVWGDDMQCVHCFIIAMQTSRVRKGKKANLMKGMHY